MRTATESDKILWTRWHGAMPRDAEDGHWEWDTFIDLARAMPQRFAVYVIEAEGELQGMRMLEVSEDDVATYGTHAFRLSTAPWNRLPEHRYKGVGSLLVSAAILRSMADGHKGHVHCESLPLAESFHQKNGMTDIKDLSIEGLKRFRFTEEAAQSFLTNLRAKGLIDG